MGEPRLDARLLERAPMLDSRMEPRPTVEGSSTVACRRAYNPTSPSLPLPLLPSATPAFPTWRPAWSRTCSRGRTRRRRLGSFARASNIQGSDGVAKERR